MVLNIEEDNVIAQIRFGLVMRLLEHVVQLQAETLDRRNVDSNGEVVLVGGKPAFEELVFIIPFSFCS